MTHFPCKWILNKASQNEITNIEVRKHCKGAVFHGNIRCDMNKVTVTKEKWMWCCGFHHRYEHCIKGYFVSFRQWRAERGTLLVSGSDVQKESGGESGPEYRLSVWRWASSLKLVLKDNYVWGCVDIQWSTFIGVGPRHWCLYIRH